MSVFGSTVKCLAPAPVSSAWVENAHFPQGPPFLVRQAQSFHRLNLCSIAYPTLTAKNWETTSYDFDRLWRTAVSVGIEETKTESVEHIPCN
jgi:hypothetical protein